MKLNIIMVIAIVLLAACEKKTDEPVDMNYDYIPLTVGAYHVYQVDSVVWDDFFTPVKIDTFSYKVKEVISEKHDDNQDIAEYRVERFIKANDTMPWHINKVFTIKLKNTALLKTIDNQTFVKFVFPVGNGVDWDGNAYNSMDEQEYEFVDHGEDFSVETNNYLNTITVEQENLMTLISNDLAIEVYAPDFGMIYKEVVKQDLDINTGEVEAGVKYTYKLLEYAK